MTWYVPGLAPRTVTLRRLVKFWRVPWSAWRAHHFHACWTRPQGALSWQPCCAFASPGSLRFCYALPALARCVPAHGRGLDSWIHEIKHDGFWLMACCNGARVRLFTRNDHDWNDRSWPSSRLWAR
jgi:hypothetical protein